MYSPQQLQSLSELYLNGVQKNMKYINMKHSKKLTLMVNTHQNKRLELEKLFLKKEKHRPTNPHQFLGSIFFSGAYVTSIIGHVSYCDYYGH